MSLNNSPRDSSSLRRGTTIETCGILAAPDFFVFNFAIGKFAGVRFLIFGIKVTEKRAICKVEKKQG
jgi:hypothetical protein